jgi:hypothetical protein
MAFPPTDCHSRQPSLLKVEAWSVARRAKSSLVEDANRRDAKLPIKTETILRKLKKMFPDVVAEAEFSWTGSFGTSDTACRRLAKCRAWTAALLLSVMAAMALHFRWSQLSSFGT